MKMKKDSKETIVKEIDHVVKLMKENADPFRKLYFFSGIHSLINRMFNIEYDPELVCIHHILASVHSGFIQRLDAMVKGDPVIILDNSYFDKLIMLCLQLKENISKNEDVNETLKKFSILVYATTGNGYYLKTKGILKI